MTKNQERYTIIGIGVAGLYFAYRQLHPSKATSTRKAASNASPSLTSGAVGGSITPFTPQAPLILQPGESVYDPNTTGLYNTPTAVPPQPTTPSGPGWIGPQPHPVPAHPASHHRKQAHKPANRKRMHPGAGGMYGHTQPPARPRQKPVKKPPTKHKKAGVNY